MKKAYRILILALFLFASIALPVIGDSAIDSNSFQCSSPESSTDSSCANEELNTTPTQEPPVGMLDWTSSSLRRLVDVVLHLDKHLNAAATFLGPWVYLLVFMVIFLETGVVIFPFLPGDSFLFALGALTSVDTAFLRLDLLIALTFIAAVLGDALNYTIGKKLGPALFLHSRIRFLNQHHLEKTQRFYEKHGAKTIVIARFAPIIRTFAPFVAGIGKMSYGRFFTCNVVGGAAWVLTFLIAGHYFGNLPAVKRNFHYVIFGIIFLSLLPIAIDLLKTIRSSQTEKKPSPARLD